MRRNITNGVLIVCSLTTFGCGDDSAGTQGPLEVTISSPTETVYTRGAVTVQVVVLGGEADRVELLRDDDVLVTLSMPYQYTWDTTGEDEGAHALVARAHRETEAYDSGARTVVVDRTPPTLVDR